MSAAHHPSIAGMVDTVQKITPCVALLLTGRPPQVQGAVLADLLAMWLAGHAPQMREEILQQYLVSVRDLIEVNEKIMFGEAGHPGAAGG